MFLGARLAPEHGLVPSGIVVAPSAVHFAFRPDIASSVITDFDNVVADLKREPDSIYYQGLARLVGGRAPHSIPAIIYWSIGLGAGLLCVAFGAVLILRRLVAKRTRELWDEASKRKDAQKALRENEVLLQNLLDHSPAIIAIRDTACRFRMINRAYEEAFGVNNEAARGKHLQEVLEDDFAKDIEAYDRKVAQSGKPMVHEHFATLKSGGVWLFPYVFRSGTKTVPLLQSAQSRRM